MNWEDAVRWCLAQPDMSELAKASYFDEPEIAAKRYRNSAEFAAIQEWLPEKKGRALDLGAGNGILSWALATDGWDVTAVEPDPSDLIGAGAIRQLSRDTGVPIKVVEAFGESIPIEEAEFDIIVARQVLHHANDLPAFCNEMGRLSRSGSTIVTLRDHVISNDDQLQKFLAIHPLHHLYGGENAFTLEQYESALRGANLEIQRRALSFQSVVNYDPRTEDEIVERLALPFGPAHKPIHALLKLVPFPVICKLAAALDRRPGRLVSYVCSRKG